MSAEPGRVQAFLAAVLRRTWLSIALLAATVAADVLARRLGLPHLLFLVLPFGGLLGVVVCLARVRGAGLLAGMLATVISVYACLVTLFLASGHLLIGS